jgi:formylglycine-generating enzyme
MSSTYFHSARRIDGPMFIAFVVMFASCESHSIAIGIAVTDSGAERPTAPAGTAPSCAQSGAGTTDCGPMHGSCCASTLVLGGPFLRSFDAVTFTDNSNPATISDFRLDTYEVTVGRFRQFIAATVAGWSPPPGSGIHTSLSHGLFDANTSAPEGGWQSEWDAGIYHTQDAWNATLACETSSSWTANAGTNEHLPIGCVSWFQAYAFCIWDGGYLPSEAEWNYAAAGGSEQRVYPWSTPATSSAIDCTYANIADCVSALLPVGALSPKGDGRWGQADLTGNVNEWVLDEYAAYPVPCIDCARVSSGTPSTTRRAIRGGTLQFPAVVVVSARFSDDPHAGGVLTGVRCARSPL